MPSATALAAARRVIELIDQDQVPAYVTWDEKWQAARDATALLILGANDA